jgi:hypothetical protein
MINIKEQKYCIVSIKIIFVAVVVLQMLAQFNTLNHKTDKKIIPNT